MQLDASFRSPYAVKGGPLFRGPDVARTVQAKFRIIPRRHLAQGVKKLDNGQNRREKRRGCERILRCHYRSLNELHRTRSKVDTRRLATCGGGKLGKYPYYLFQGKLITDGGWAFLIVAAVL